MTEDFLRKLITLVRLRYLLIWAQARTRNGKIAILVLVYLLVFSIALLVALAGTGAAIADNEFGQEGFFGRWILSGLFINGLGISLLLGVGAQAAFTEEALRRYPLDAKERFAVRQTVGLLDPIWLILGLGSLGMAVGFYWYGKGKLLAGLCAAVLFVVSDYLAAMILLAVVGLLVRTRRGAGVLGAIVLAAVSFGPLAVSVIGFLRGRDFWQGLDYLLSFTPPGAAASMMLGTSFAEIAGNALLLIAWCIAQTAVLNWLERLPPVSDNPTRGGIRWNDGYDRVASLFGRKYGPHVGKALRYNLRCNLIRFSLITSPLLVILGKYMMPGRSPDGELIITLALFFITSSATGAAMMLNLLGFEEAGIRRYALGPSTLTTALRAGSLASLTLRGGAMGMAFLLWVMVSHTIVNVRALLVVLGVVLGSLFLFNGFGLWTSVISIKRANFESMWNNRLSLGANIVMLGGSVTPYVIAIILSERIEPETIFQFWWIPALLMLAGMAFYAFSFFAIEPVLESRRESIINLIAGAKDR